MPDPKSVTMTVEFRLVGSQVEVRTDGSAMGAYTSCAKAGAELGREFKHRLEQLPITDDAPFFAGGMSHREDRIASQNDSE